MGLTIDANSHVFNHTCIGASHVKNETVCQDASASYSDQVCDIIVVADGHGSPKYFRSHQGSALAVQVALDQIKRFVKEYVHQSAVEFVQLGTLADQDGVGQENTAERVLRRLCASIVSEWYNRIEDDWNTNPPTDKEMANVPANDKAMFGRGENMEKAYGSTLIAFTRTSAYWFAIHLGDGKCIAFKKDGSWYEPIPWDKKCFLNLTTSLSDEHPEESFRFCMGDSSSCPEALFIGSDGMDDSYSPIERLASFYGLIIRLAAKNGFESIENDIRDFLPQLSDKGSKDDMSIAYWMKTDSINNLAIEIATETIKKKEAQIDSLQKKEASDTEQIQKLKMEKQGLMEELECYNKKLKELLNKVVQAIKEGETGKPTDNNPIQNFFLAMKTKIKQISSLGQSLLDNSEAITPILAKIEKLETALKSLDKQLIHNREQIDALKKEIADLKASVSELNKSKENI